MWNPIVNQCDFLDGGIKSFSDGIPTRSKERCPVTKKDSLGLFGINFSSNGFPLERIVGMYLPRNGEIVYLFFSAKLGFPRKKKSRIEMAEGPKFY